MTSRFALAAAAGLLLGAYSANAADLGGGCCADLEERVAELEATTARKGNRVVSLKVYGQVGRGILVYDAEDGKDFHNESESDTTLISEDGSNFGFTGTATIKPGLTAGYKIEYDVVDEQGASPKVKQNHLWIESEQLGRVTLGQASTATDGIAHIVLAKTYSDSGAYQVGIYEDIGGTYGDLDGGRGDVLRYDSPSIAGFIVSASWSDDLDGTGGDDYFDVTLRYSGEFNTFRVAAGVGYTDDQAGDEIIQGSASIMHVPTGLFAAFSAGDSDDTDESYWYVTGGIEKAWLAYGATTLYGEYGAYDDAQDDTLYGVGLVQSFDSAALDVYAQYRHVEEDEGGFTGPDEFDTFVIGTKIAF